MTVLGIVRVDRLKPRDRVTWWRHWGQDGRAEMQLNPSLTPGEYYGQLLMHMRDGGQIPPLKVGPWKHGEPGQLYVMDGHHRFAIARELGWETVPVEDAGPEYENSHQWEPTE